MDHIRAFDMFCGAGGASLGAREAGARIVGGVDLWGPAVESFKLNFKDAHVFERDLRRLTPEEVLAKTGPIDLLISSPECTHHTCARGAKPRSEESKDTAFQVIRYAEAMKPRWITLENVVHMKPWARYDELKAELARLQYKVHEQIIDASQFGVAQRRRRLFMIADLQEQPQEILPLRPSYQTVWDILAPEGTYKMTPLRIERRAKDTLARAERAIAELGPDKAFLIVYYGSDGAGGWQRMSEPLRTITTVDRFAYVKPTPAGHMMRMLQPDELRRAMGFPDNYQFPQVNRRDKVKLMGNAVCSPVMEAIVHALARKLQMEKNSKAA
ncbi:DNA (cytosine-5)-methyltransferase 1 [Pseudomonas citronellolis]|uniref:DNA cytosine methyltransferase n=1 Tax=Pseudomonas citronellolis TaxID=53408 RepID=UPI0020A22FC0|nr:DNA cytosine methyltransferase [Pseudomonas citronellolis]MCP1642030.1 DNA (cytosine-5)-methyltransferase 1 [Pseudomonas citronellolis]MCP1664948.1 DNA (cytosine-5)-methyltransferase 1 [Pseudomonas citronellolis]MCP1695593.1 DNA (cytosine-5)-methyltransferase 1 [Pseudomonas citronellolis]MCP1702784.1 DNA (cytosine-5)-methyltransferase 1 [Pseudomonas citronellolis]MCP1796744.1 DNA (cytosine-5)-methyltransferase 1 [Pseudomonas citronellolis]